MRTLLDVVLLTAVCLVLNRLIDRTRWYQRYVAWCKRASQPQLWSLLIGASAGWLALMALAVSL